MSKFFYRYPKIRNVKDAAAPLIELGKRPFTVSYTEKHHGTNGAIVIEVRDGERAGFYAQSRNRILELDSDNFGFCRFVHANVHLIPHAAFDDSPNYNLVIYGEYIGKGIQNGVGISELEERYFVVFGVHCDFELNGEAPPLPVSLSYAYKNYVGTKNPLILCVSNPDLKGAGEVVVKDGDLVEMMDKLHFIADAFSVDSPLARILGSQGKGEGIVCSVNNESIIFKVKGKAYEGEEVPKRFTGNRYSEEDLGILSNLTEERLQQGLAYLNEFGHPITLPSIPVLLKFMIDDLVAEIGPISPKATKLLGNNIVSWYKGYVNSNIDGV